jgi:hypothetical protein
MLVSRVGAFVFCILVIKEESHKKFNFSFLVNLKRDTS